MTTWTRRTRIHGWAIAALFVALSPCFADLPQADGKPADDQATVQSITIEPDTIKLRGKDSVQQVFVTGEFVGSSRDLTRKVTYTSSNENVVRVDAGGVLYPVGDGSAEVTAELAGRAAKATVVVEHTGSELPINFPNQVVPIFTKLGCNSGGCHGKASGQNGFRLSLLGFEPNVDFESLVKEGRGRRVFPAAPDKSLLLAKATALVPHGGGKRMEVDSHDYKMIRRWISTGLPYGKSDDPVVEKISVSPAQRVLVRGGEQQITVTVHYSDGTTEDVTRHAQYESNETEVAIVDNTGLVKSLDMSGEAAVMARYQGQVSVFRATVPLGVPIASYPDFPQRNFVDQHTLAKWTQLGIVPSELCSDSEFMRRASLDICGTLPTAEEVAAFASDGAADKRDRLVDKLIDRKEYADFFALKWSDILRVKRRGNPNLRNSTYGFARWIRHQLETDTPYDKFVREILGAQGDIATSPPVSWYREIRTPEAAVDDAAQVFLGLRIQCARCHHHPFEKWSQDDYYGFAAFFARVGRKPSLDGGQDEQRIFAQRTGEINHPKTAKPMKPKGLDAAELDVPNDQDRRQYLADWLGDPQNPFFARAVANRMWAHFFTRGIVNPEDDMRVTNPPSNPELLDALANDFIDHQYSLKHLVRTICTSRTYQLSAIPNEYNKHDKQNYARYYPKRMQAEVMHDAIVSVTGSPTNFNGLPAGFRAIELPDESSATYFLTVFGKPQRESACECERVGQANLAQSLHLLNSNEIQGKISNGSRITGWMNDKEKSDSDKMAELFMTCYSRLPTADEMEIALKHIEMKKDKKKEAYEDLVWALLNTKEFLFND
jgi:hypothetical protein